MSVSRSDSTTKSRFNFILCLDLVVLVSILVIAGRPEALAITVSAIIICAAALIYRGTLGVKAYVANAAAKAKAARNTGQQARRMPAAAPAMPAKPAGKSWLRDSE